MDPADHPPAPPVFDDGSVDAADLGAALDGAPDLVAVRHPIYDTRMRVTAYELVLHWRAADGTLREGHGAATPDEIAEVAESLVGTHPVHIKVSRRVLLSGAASTVPPERIVIEVPPEVGCDASVAEAMRSLGRTGHAVVLDNFRYQEDALPLLRAARAVKVDAGSLHHDDLAREAELVRGAHDAMLIATGVETQDMLAACRALDFALFQGFFFLEPALSEATDELKPNQLARVRLLAKLQAADPDFDELQEIISYDVALSYSLLRFINSAFFALPRKVESVRDAAVLLGTQHIRRWATLAVLADSDDGKPSELMVTALTRARMCELLAPAYGERDSDAFFTTGLFSVVDALMDMSMIEVLASLPFSREINEAILNFEGPKGEALRAAIAWERANLSELVTPPGVTVGEVGDTYRQAVGWAATAASGLS
jgi:EAL and modified HD-GYP domain-containing signal transduction protein